MWAERQEIEAVAEGERQAVGAERQTVGERRVVEALAEEGETQMVAEQAVGTASEEREGQTVAKVVAEQVVGEQAVGVAVVQVLGVGAEEGGKQVVEVAA